MSISHKTMPQEQQLSEESSAALIICLCLSLFIFSCVGVWRWFDLHTSIHLMELEEISTLLGFVVLPIGLCFFVFVKIAQHNENRRVQSGYRISFDQLQKRLNDRQLILHAITDHPTELIAIFDKHNDYWFVNDRAARHLNREADDIIGMSPMQVLEADRAQQLIVRLDKVRRSGKPIDALEQIRDEKGHTRYVQVYYRALPPLTDLSHGVMFRENDVTNLLVERERREVMFRQVLATLVAVIDRRDPYASGHSARVGQLSRAIAEEMVLSENEIEAAEVAGSLMNFGKVLVSRGILTKTSPLSSDELQRVRDSILTSADILSIIDFSGPVVPTLKQVLERYDGSGVPLGLRGGHIIVTARIVTVANAYVALVSPRAHRPSMGLKEAIQHMMQDVDKIYDPAVVRALAHFIQNRPNKLDWLVPTKQN